MELVQYVPMPIIIGGGNSGPVPKEILMAFLGIFIIMNVLWIISWAIFGIRRLIYYKTQSEKKYTYRPTREDYMIDFVLDMTMSLIWAVLILFYSGIKLSYYLQIWS